MGGLCWALHRSLHQPVSARIILLHPFSNPSIRGAVKSAVDDYPDSHYVSCSSFGEATEMYSLYRQLLARDIPTSENNPPQPPYQPPANTSSDPDLIPTSSDPDHISTPATSGQQNRRRRPFQPFILDESIRSLTDHESWWVTWAAVSPGMYYGM